MGEQAESERRLAAIMFTDIAGFTAMAQRDEKLAMRLLDEQRKLVRVVLGRHNGREVKTMGDAFLVEFASSVDAVSCAAEIQKESRVANDRLRPDERLLVRIGVHLGDVIHDGTDVAGDAVNVASRIEPLASPGGICVSAPVQASVLNKVPFRFESLGTPRLKNVAIPVEVFRWQATGNPRRSLSNPPRL